MPFWELMCVTVFGRSCSDVMACDVMKVDISGKYHIPATEKCLQKTLLIVKDKCWYMMCYFK